MKPPPYTYTAGNTALLMSIPHVGTVVPADIAANMTQGALGVPDTDWALDRLYDFAGELGLNVVAGNYSRYVIDLNRPPDDAPLYPGGRNTELVPTTTFDRESIYPPGLEPDAAEIGRRRTLYWEPYHVHLSSVLEQLRARHGIAILFDCHSIRSRVPRFFDGRLADHNLGTADGASCSPDLRDALRGALAEDKRYSLVVDERFKGGYITRHYGKPGAGIHAFQLELSQATYAAPELPFRFAETAAAELRPCLRAMLEAALQWAAAHKKNSEEGTS